MKTIKISLLIFFFFLIKAMVRLSDWHGTQYVYSFKHAAMSYALNYGHEHNIFFRTSKPITYCVQDIFVLVSVWGNPKTVVQSHQSNDLQKPKNKISITFTCAQQTAEETLSVTSNFHAVNPVFQVLSIDPAVVFKSTYDHCFRFS